MDYLQMHGTSFYELIDKQSRSLHDFIAKEYLRLEINDFIHKNCTYFELVPWQHKASSAIVAKSVLSGFGRDFASSLWCSGGFISSLNTSTNEVQRSLFVVDTFILRSNTMVQVDFDVDNTIGSSSANDL